MLKFYFKIQYHQAIPFFFFTKDSTARFALPGNKALFIKM